MNREASRPGSGFTLVELLVVIAISGILAGLLLPGLARCKLRAKQVNEANAARQLLLAWQIYADDHRDTILPGYSARAEAQDDRGNPLASPVRDRYPWRLAPALAHSFRAIYVNESRRFLEAAERMSHADFVYRASLYPSLGYNSVFLGGDEQAFNPELAATVYGSGWLARRGSDLREPGRLLVFASARSRPDGERLEPGYHVVHPPYLTARRWDAEFEAGTAPERWGYIHPRWNRRAVAGMADGHIETLKGTALQDMRHWANPADRPDWTLRPTGSP